MYISELILSGVFEAIAVIIAAISIVCFLLRKKTKALEAALKKAKSKLELAEAKVASLEEGAAKTKTKLTIKGASRDDALETARKQIKNLEQFRKLYFASEAAFSAMSNMSNKYEDMENTLAQKEQEIKNLSDLFAQEKQRASAEHQYSEELERAIEKLEMSKNKMAKEVEQTKDGARVTRQLEKELDEIRQKANELMKESGKKNTDIANYKKMIANLKSQAGESPGDREKINELLVRLSEKDKEIELLRKECDTLGVQYHELAVQSLGSQKDSDDQLKVEIDNMILELGASAKQLMKTQKLYLDLEHALIDVPQETMPDHQSRLDAARIEKIEAENGYRELSSKVEAMVSVDDREELLRIKNLLRSKSEEAEQNINDHALEMTKSLEDNPSKDEDYYKQRCVELEKAVKKYKRLLNKKPNTNDEFEELQAEYVALESRYLTLLNKR